MIKFFTLLFSISKIKGIVTYLYEGLVIITNTVNATIVEIRKTVPDFRYLKQLEQVQSYLIKATEGAGMVLKWIGIEKDDVISAKIVTSNVVENPFMLREITCDFEQELKKYR
jgi:hypothetical protein